MSLDALIMLAGAFVAVLPFLGFPGSWDNIFFLLAGIFVIALGIVVRRRLAHKVTPEGLARGRSTPEGLARAPDATSQRTETSAEDSLFSAGHEKGIAE